jgi:hypothetical protein
MRSFRMVFAVLMLLQSATSFQVTRSRHQAKLPIPSSPSSALTVRGGATRANPLHSFAVDAISVVNSFYQTSPFLAAALTCGSKACAADYVAQRRHSNTDVSSKLDTARNIAFVLYGAVYQGVAQEV